ncbi:hypothetical protein LGM54_06080 [Burkholderia cenocepacia]|uniref:hypothetical protein n=1 Tax=Burkholderia cenocepacia TaxID=95486 RepID=UPI001CF25430|nr:hypothetical protein [Burkholderia cenocepacia]MCA7962520.1 hypothetical protein [Burkholderia cenocepacia]
MNCKPGILAYIVSCDFKCNVGAVVEVLGPAEPDDDQEIGFWWRVRATGLCPLAYSAYGEKSDKLSGFDVEVDCHDDNLRPITGLPITDDVEDEVTA